MSAFVLLHGAGDVGWFWHLVQAGLERRGHRTVAPDLPCEDDTAGLADYAEVAVTAAEDLMRAADAPGPAAGGPVGVADGPAAGADLVVVAQSFAGFVAPLVAERLPVRLLVLVAPMIPVPGEAPADYWANTRYDEADPTVHDDVFYHDLPPGLAAEARRRGRGQSDARAGEPLPLAAWPPVPTRVLLCRDDRLFPLDYLRRVTRERLGVTPDEMDGGHCAALSRPAEMAERLDTWARTTGRIDH